MNYFNAVNSARIDIDTYTIGLIDTEEMSMRNFSQQIYTFEHAASSCSLSLTFRESRISTRSEVPGKLQIHIGHEILVAESNRLHQERDMRVVDISEELHGEDLYASDSQ
uniref:AlNc14C338G10752 protein n=1 Tax=Albugo laibachii Nc14 TaxID=890382 RepID=F0WWZ0_9STRA|nr:AlNc14C338G10752 [Albugo laibachii Nc14]|eukprot:CCA25976.1 AlNc14C338G10752 [Albugo laibachii Nc14]